MILPPSFDAYRQKGYRYTRRLTPVRICSQYVFPLLPAQPATIYMLIRHKVASSSGAFEVTRALLDAGLSIFVEEALESGKSAG